MREVLEIILERRATSAYIDRAKQIGQDRLHDHHEYEAVLVLDASLVVGLLEVREAEKDADEL